jgi:heme/copper-type cytochrome/quinol oxidase subunit 3
MVLAQPARDGAVGATGAISMTQPELAAQPASDANGTAQTDGVLDVRHLPTFGFSHRSLMWWGTMGLMLVEGTVFAIAVMMYFYLRSLSATWPITTAPPDLLWGTLNTLVLLVSLWPNQMAKRAAERGDRQSARIWLSACLVLALAFLAIRAMEFTTLNVDWSLNAYGSVVWLLLGLHTTHLVTDTIDTGVLDVLLFTGPFEGRRFVDVSENAVYWYFVVLSWLPIYVVIYIAPRF